MTIHSEDEQKEKTQKRSLWDVLGKIATVVGLIGGVIGLIAYLAGGLHPRVAGEWVLENKTLDTTYSSYKDMTLTYEIFLTQSGTNLTGSGEKMTENGHPEPSSAKTHIDISGSVGIMSIDATFQEHGSIRPSTGAIHLRRKMDGTWEGTFQSDVANSSGVSSIKRATVSPSH